MNFVSGENSESAAALQTVGINGNPWFRYFFADLAELLKQRFGSSIHVYVATQAAVDMFREVDHSNSFDSIEVAPSTVTIPLPVISDPDQTISVARALEAKYGLTFNWLLVPDRLYGRGYAPGGYYHPRSIQSESANYFQAIEVYIQLFAYWESVFESRGLTTLMEVNVLQAAVARRYGALIRTPATARHKNYCYWTTDEFGYSEDIARAFRSPVLPNKSEELAGVPYQGQLFNEEASRRFRVRGVVAEILRQSRNHAAWRISGHHKGRLYRYRDQVALAIRRWRDYLKVTGSKTTRLAEISNRPFVFYALHVEPEIWFQGRSPEHIYQLAAITSLSRDLPAGVLLAVKEHHPAVGRRPDLFYDQITDLKNVVLLNMEEKGQDVVEKAAAVATICGTVGQEAAALGKPIITFGRHNIYNILPFVKVVTQEEELKPALAWALDCGVDQTQARAAGQRFLDAVAVASFDMKSFTYRNLQGYNRDSVVQAFDRLVESVSVEWSARAVL